MYVFNNVRKMKDHTCVFLFQPIDSDCVLEYLSITPVWDANQLVETCYLLTMGDTP